ncbi:hypothetical protein PsorP6_014085 [Peronosclerospora sorghi]|uniref:Uncharacterized protein n=1 Tax=Peronosclerospora sorghi TaxID=230839 RepID=A0ACC0VI19_9STRA|nr:hypothetical protein PsorP6_014085 [Peronosclerospora sorghi]
MSSAVEIDGGVEVDVYDDYEQDENASMNYGVDLNDPTVDNDDRAVGAVAQDTGTGTNAVNGSVDRDSHESEPSHDSPATAEDGDQVSTEEGNNSVLSGDDAGRASDAGVALRDMPEVDSESGRDGEPQLHDGESEGEDQQSDGSESTTGVCGSVCGSMDMDNLGENQRGVSVEINGPVATLEPDIDQFMEQARVLKRDGPNPMHSTILGRNSMHASWSSLPRAVARHVASFSTATASASTCHTAAYVAIGGGAAAAAVAAYHGVVPHEWMIRHLADPLMPLLRLLPPETSHKLAVQCARFGLTPKDPEEDPTLLHVHALGLEFPNPLGLAAGFDKDGEAMEALLDMGFGSVEIGSVTPVPQPGNPTPRVFRLPEDAGVINRYGFNSKGLAYVRTRLERYVAGRTERQAARSGHRTGVLGVNLGKNKLTQDAAADYVVGVHTLGKFADYLVVNVSSPNTPGLRTLQGKRALQTLLERVLEARDHVATTEKRRLPLLVKIAPDLTDEDKRDIAEVALKLQLDGLVVSNTTISRPETLKGAAKREAGGLSGRPLRDLSTKVVGDMYALTKGKIPLIGVGGVATGQDAYEKIRAGASLVQMYSCLIYEGPLAVPRAKKELAALLRRDGYENVADAVGAAHK